MSLADKQRDALIADKGEPKLRLEFDVFEDGHVSMWTHFNHGDDFAKVRERLLAIQTHLSEFLRDESMCPFHNQRKVSEDGN